jgi:hypothetical protein
VNQTWGVALPNCDLSERSRSLRIRSCGGSDLVHSVHGAGAATSGLVHIPRLHRSRWLRRVSLRALSAAVRDCGAALDGEYLSEWVGARHIRAAKRSAQRRTLFSCELSSYPSAWRDLNQSQGSPLGGIVTLLGYLVLIAGVDWRVVRFLV